MGSFCTESSAAKAHDVATLRIHRESSLPTQVIPTPIPACCAVLPSN